VESPSAGLNPVETVASYRYVADDIKEVIVVTDSLE
jgi:hypothetical protein